MAGISGRSLTEVGRFLSDEPPGSRHSVQKLRDSAEGR